MTVHRFIVAKEYIDEANALVTLTNAGQVHQISKVLRAKPGQILQILDGEGNLYICSLQQLARSQVLARIEEIERESQDPLRLKTCVVLSLLKGDQFEFTLQKLTEIGVSFIIPCLTKHTVVKLKGEDLEKRYERWLSIVREATEQSEGFRPPQIDRPRLLLETLSSLALQKDNFNIFLAERGTSPPLLNLFESNLKEQERYKRVNLIVGPEGGFSDEEFDLGRKNDFHFASLGKRVFKSGTAAISACAALNFFFDNQNFKRNIDTD